MKSNSSATCGGTQASTSGNAELVGLTVAGQSILVSNPNLSISLPGGISVIINQQTRASGRSSGSITVNAPHVTGPSIGIVVASANSDITCSYRPQVGQAARKTATLSPCDALRMMNLTARATVDLTAAL